MALTSIITKPYEFFSKSLDFLQPLADLLIRLYVANVFWKSGINKYESWGTTTMLFEDIYSVPLLSPETAAAAATFVELAFPVLLVLGFFGRFAAFVLFVFNIIAVISFPEINDPGIAQHTTWGLLLLVCVTHGPGKLSVDHFLQSRFSFWTRY